VLNVLEILVDKIDIIILYYLYTNKKLSNFNSSQLKPIIKHFENSSQEQTPAYTTLLRRINILLEKELISLGYKVKNSNTYYLSEKGKVFIEENIVKKEDIFDYISVDDNGEIIGGEEQ